MKYMGSKNKHAKYILPIVLKNRTKNQFYVEPFVGGSNIIDKVTGNRIGSDINDFIISMWRAIQKGWKPPANINKEIYIDIKGNKSKYRKRIVGWIGIACSYSGKWFGGFAGKIKTNDGIRDYQDEAHRNLSKQIEGIKGIKFLNCDYIYLDIPPGSIIYCDPPYSNTTGYLNKFDHVMFWQWCRDKEREGHQVFISEYKAPNDFECLWSKEVNSSLSANGKIGGNKKSIEKLFRFKRKQLTLEIVFNKLRKNDEELMLL